MTGATCGAGDAHSSGTPDLAFGFCEGAEFNNVVQTETGEDNSSVKPGPYPPDSSVMFRRQVENDADSRAPTANVYLHDDGQSMSDPGLTSPAYEIEIDCADETDPELPQTPKPKRRKKARNTTNRKETSASSQTAVGKVSDESLGHVSETSSKTSHMVVDKMAIMESMGLKKSPVKMFPRKIQIGQKHVGKEKEFAEELFQTSLQKSPVSKKLVNVDKQPSPSSPKKRQVLKTLLTEDKLPSPPSPKKGQVTQRLVFDDKQSSPPSPKKDQVTQRLVSDDKQSSPPSPKKDQVTQKLVSDVKQSSLPSPKKSQVTQKLVSDDKQSSLPSPKKSQVTQKLVSDDKQSSLPSPKKIQVTKKLVSDDKQSSLPSPKKSHVTQKLVSDDKQSSLPSPKKSQVTQKLVTDDTPLSSSSPKKSQVTEKLVINEKQPPTPSSATYEPQDEENQSLPSTSRKRRTSSVIPVWLDLIPKTSKRQKISAAKTPESKGISLVAKAPEGKVISSATKTPEVISPVAKTPDGKVISSATKTPDGKTISAATKTPEVISPVAKTPDGKVISSAAKTSEVKAISSTTKTPEVQDISSVAKTPESKEISSVAKNADSKKKSSFSKTSDSSEISAMLRKLKKEPVVSLVRLRSDHMTRESSKKQMNSIDVTPKSTKENSDQTQSKDVQRMEGKQAPKGNETPKMTKENSGRPQSKDVQKSKPIEERNITPEKAKGNFRETRPDYDREESVAETLISMKSGRARPTTDCDVTPVPQREADSSRETPPVYGQQAAETPHTPRSDSPEATPVSSDTSHKCALCGRVYSNAGNLRRHQVTHSGFKAYQCSFCADRFYFPNYLQDHVILCRSNPDRYVGMVTDHDRMISSLKYKTMTTIVPSPSEMGTFTNLTLKQDEDKYTGKSGQQVMKMLEDEGSDADGATGPQIKFQQIRDKNLYETATWDVPAIKTEPVDDATFLRTENGKYICHICNKVLVHRVNLQRHLKTHIEFKRYKCTYCSRRFAVAQYLKDHVVSCARSVRRVPANRRRQLVGKIMKRNIIIVPSVTEEGTFINAEVEEHVDSPNPDQENDVTQQSSVSSEEEEAGQASSVDDENGKVVTKTSETDPESEDDDEIYKCTEKEWKKNFAHRSNDACFGKRTKHTLDGALVRIVEEQRTLGESRMEKDPGDNTPYHCSVCNRKKFASIHTLRRHLLTHQDTQPYCCEICGLKFHLTSRFKLHVFHLHFRINPKKIAMHRRIQALSASETESTSKSAIQTNETSPAPKDDATKKNFCEVCQVSFVSERQFHMHTKQHDSAGLEVKKKISCHVCGKVFRLETMLTAHKVVCRGQQSTDKEADKKKNLPSTNKQKILPSVQKLKTYGSRVLFQCLECKNKFFKYENMLWHQFYNHGLKSFCKCPICQIKIEKGTLMEHLAATHPNATKESRTYPKQEKAPLKQLTVIYKCNLCDRKFTRELSLLIHKERHEDHADVLYPADGNNCPRCKMTFSTFGNLKRHYRITHSSDKPFMCDACGKSFKTNDTLKNHAKTHDREANLKYNCKFCGKGFFKQRGVLLHETVHTPGAMGCMCDICGKSFRLKTNLRKHVLGMHTNQRIHKCEQCSQAFKLREQLMNHMRLHVIKDGKVREVGYRYGKIYECDLCGSFKSSSGALKVHMLTHSDERPHRCEICDQGFKVKSKLQRHVACLHSTDNYVQKPRKVRPVRKRSPSKRVSRSRGEHCDVEEEVVDNIVEVIFNGEESTMAVAEENKLLSLLDHANDRESSSAHFSTDPSVIAEAVEGIRQLSGITSDYITVQDVEYVEDEPGTYIVTGDNVQIDDGSGTGDTFNINVEDGTKTIVYYITTSNAD